MTRIDLPWYFVFVHPLSSAGVQVSAFVFHLSALSAVRLLLDYVSLNRSLRADPNPNLMLSSL